MNLNDINALCETINDTLNKKAFVPSMPQGQVDPSAAPPPQGPPGAGGPPMDPSMMQAGPPGAAGAGGPPMDPAMMQAMMMQGGGMPPPGAAGPPGAGGPPMDPAMMQQLMAAASGAGGGPPQSPPPEAAPPQGPPDSGQPVTLSMDDLRAVVEDVLADMPQQSQPAPRAGGSGKSGGGLDLSVKKELSELRIQMHEMHKLLDSIHSSIKETAKSHGSAIDALSKQQQEAADAAASAAPQDPNAAAAPAGQAKSGGQANQGTIPGIQPMVPGTDQTIQQLAQAALQMSGK